MPSPCLSLQDKGRTKIMEKNEIVGKYHKNDLKRLRIAGPAVMDGELTVGVIFSKMF